MLPSQKPALEGGKPVRSEKLVYVGMGCYLYDEKELHAVKRVVQRAAPFRFYGPNTPVETEAFEREFASLIGRKYALAVSSGSAALHVALRALGMGPGDEVIVPPITWPSPALMVLASNAIPVFADVDYLTLNLSPESVETKINGKTKAIIVVHYLGLPAEMDELLKLAKERNLAIIEDCALALGAKYKGRIAGSMGDEAIFSFQLHKIITSGDGGCIVMDREDIYERAYRIHDLGLFKHCKESYEPFKLLGYNYRITELQSALLRVQLDKLPSIIDALKERAKILLEGVEKIDGLVARYVALDREPVYPAVVLRLDRKIIRTPIGKIIKALEAEGLPAERIPLPNYLLPVFRNKYSFKPNSFCPFSCPLYNKRIDYHKGLCPNAERAYEDYFEIHISLSYSEEDLKDYIKALEKIVRYYRR